MRNVQRLSKPRRDTEGSRVGYQVDPKWEASVMEEDIVSAGAKVSEVEIKTSTGRCNDLLVTNYLTKIVCSDKTLVIVPNVKDACNFAIALDKFMADKWYPLEPRFNVYHLDKPYKVCSNVAIPKPVIGTIGSWLQG